MTNNSNPLINEILDKARKKADAIIKDAEAQSERILDDANAKAESMAEAEHRLFLEKLDRINGKEESAKRNIDRLTELKAMDSAYCAVMDRVDKEFKKLAKSKEFSSVLSLWIAEAAIGLGKKEAKVAYSSLYPVGEEELKRAQELVKEAAGSDVALTLDSLHIDGIGVVLTSLDGKVSYNNQLDTRLRRYQRDIRKIIQEENARQNSR